MRNLLKIGLVVSFVVLVALLCTKGNYGHWATESRAWAYASSLDVKKTYNKYLEKYPSGSHVKDAKNAILAIEKKAEMKSSYDVLMSYPSADRCKNFLNNYPNSPYEKTVRKKLNDLLLAEVVSTYGNYSLRTGDTPYRKWYGGNYYSNHYNHYSTITITAPNSSDVVVIIKHNDAGGKVVAHGYIEAGDKLSINVPNGRYQTFFYYGKGWYPEKQMAGVKGGFLKGEIFSKADSENLSDVELSYVLQLTTKITRK